MIDSSLLIQLINAHYSDNEEDFKNAIGAVVQSYENVGMKYSASAIKKCVEGADNNVTE